MQASSPARIYSCLLSFSPARLHPTSKRLREEDLNKGLRNPDGTVSPRNGKGGMSASLVPTFPKSVQDRVDAGKLTVFKIKVSDLAKKGLTIDPDGGTHVAIQPATTMSEEQYQKNIRQTRNLWQKY